MGIGDRIKKARAASGLSQGDLAKAVNRSQSSVAEWETDDTSPRRDVIPKIASALGVSVNYLEFGEASEPPPEGNAKPAEPGTFRAALGPVYASAYGGSDEQKVETGNVVEYRAKPQRWSGVKDLYAFYVIGDSMAPRINAGEMVWIHPHRLPAVGQEAVFIRKDNHGAESTVMVKALAASNSRDWIVRQHNPPKEFSLPKREWNAQLVVDIDLNR